MKFSITAAAAGFLLVSTTLAAPLEARGQNLEATGKKAADIILELAPASKSCDETTQCRTNVQAADFLVKAMMDYKLYYPGQIAAVLALTIFESDGYKYKKNMYPGRPGQGTSNMQMIDYNVKYANSIPDLKPKVAEIGKPDTDKKKNAIRDLVIDDKYNFGSGPWFLTTQCSPEVVTGLEKATDASFEAYMGCIGTEMTQERKDGWAAAKKAFGI